MHQEQLAEHGGSDGIRDESPLDSALAKPHNVFAYASEPDLFQLAASYAYGIARNHAFIDGNKRTALVVSLTFLDRNGWDIISAKEDLYFTFLHLADGSLSEEDLAAWFRKHTAPLQSQLPRGHRRWLALGLQKHIHLYATDLNTSACPVARTSGVAARSRKNSSTAARAPGHDGHP